MMKERIEIEIPRDIIFAISEPQEMEKVRDKLKLALAILLFQEKTISLGKATELSGLSRVKFINILNNLDITVYEHGEKDFERDQIAIEHYMNAASNLSSDAGRR